MTLLIQKALYFKQEQFLQPKSVVGRSGTDKNWYLHTNNNLRLPDRPAWQPSPGQWAELSRADTMRCWLHTSQRAPASKPGPSQRIIKNFTVKKSWRLEGRAWQWERTEGDTGQGAKSVGAGAERLRVSVCISRQDWFIITGRLGERARSHQHSSQDHNLSSCSPQPTQSGG